MPRPFFDNDQISILAELPPGFEQLLLEAAMEGFELHRGHAAAREHDFADLRSGALAFMLNNRVTAEVKRLLQVHPFDAVFALDTENTAGTEVHVGPYLAVRFKKIEAKGEKLPRSIVTGRQHAILTTGATAAQLNLPYNYVNPEEERLMLTVGYMPDELDQSLASVRIGVARAETWSWFDLLQPADDLSALPLALADRIFAQRSQRAA